MFGKNSAKKVLKIIDSRIILLASVVLGLFLYPDSISAQATYNALVTIPGIPNGAGVTVYLSGLYTFLISVVGVVAMGAIVIGGARYLTSAGNPSAIEDAKHTIYSAIIGLLLAITSWVIIWEINPDITVLKNPAMPWEAVGYSPGGKDPLAMCDGPGNLGNGTADAPCHCIDGAQVFVAVKTPTILTLTLPASGDTAPAATALKMAGKLTDSSSLPLNNKPVKIYLIYGSGMEFYVQLNTDPSGNYSNIIPITPPINCGAVIAIRAYFAGDDTYFPSASAPNTFTFTGLPNCSTTDFPLPLIDFTGGTGCKNICSNPILASDGLYHCMKADLRVGTTFMPMGKQISVKVGETVYFDGRTYSADYAYPGLKTDVPSDGPGFDNGIDSYEIDFTKPWLGWTSDYAATESMSCSFLPGLVSALGDALFDIQYTKGMVSTSYAAAGKYEGLLRIQSKNGCHKAFDKVQINVNP